MADVSLKLSAKDIYEKDFEKTMARGYRREEVDAFLDDIITDYVNENDFIGLYGTQLGRTVYIRDMGSDKLRKRNRDHDLTMKYIQGAIASAAGKGESALAAGWVVL